MNDDLRDRLDAVADAVGETDTGEIEFIVTWGDDDTEHDRPADETLVADFTGES